MRRVLAPLWLATPSRYAATPPDRARWLVIAWALVLLLTLAALATPLLDARAGGGAAPSDLALYAAIVDGVRGGGDYYAVAADALRSGGYPLKPFVTFRLPTLAVIEAALPGSVVAGLLYALAAGMTLAWYARLRAAMRRPAMLWAALVLLVGGSVACWQPGLAGLHEVWAGLLLALSLARWRPAAWVEALGWAVAAAMIREISLLYVMIMAALAWRDGDRRQALVWAISLALPALLLTAHVHGVAQVVRAGDPASPGWTGLLGPGFPVRVAWASTALSLLPLGIAAPLVGLAWFGWTAWRDPIATRVAAVLAAYAALLAVAGRTDTFYWGLMTAPLLLVGLAFVPDGVRDLLAGARDRRRITVRRVER